MEMIKNKESPDWAGRGTTPRATFPPPPIPRLASNQQSVFRRGRNGGRSLAKEGSRPQPVAGSRPAPSTASFSSVREALDVGLDVDLFLPSRGLETWATHPFPL